MIKALVCDIDNTLADGVSWYGITEGLGVSALEHKHIFESFLEGSITYEESKDRLLGLWRSGSNADKAHLTALFESWQLRDGAVELIDYARQQGLQLVLITGSVDLFAEIISRKISVPAWYANTRLVWSADGELVDYEYQRDQAEVKLRQLQEFVGSNRLLIGECAVIGDSDNDLAIFQATGNGVAVGNADLELLKAARKHAGTLAEVQELLKQL